MNIFRRVKKYLSPEEYHSLDKRNRAMPDGEIVPTHDAEGREIPDPVPLAPPVGWHAQPSMFEVMRDMIRSEHLKAYAEAQGAENLDESMDFDVEEDELPTSPYEGDFDPLEDLTQRRQASFRKRFIEEEENASYREWRNKLLEEQQARGGSALSRESASAAKPRPSSKRPEPARDDDEA